LATAQSMSALDYARLHSDYGLYLGRRVKEFIDSNGLSPDYIASHGHTIFHQPAVRFTAQIGSGAGIAAESGVDTICDFRTTDVALYGQGAPLVPVGDRILLIMITASIWEVFQTYRTIRGMQDRPMISPLSIMY